MTPQKIPFEIAMAIPAAALPVVVPATSRLPGCSFLLQDGYSGQSLPGNRHRRAARDERSATPALFTAAKAAEICYQAFQLQI
jgi:hypothetical protein